jgi:hypothetical protein
MVTSRPQWAEPPPKIDSKASLCCRVRDVSCRIPRVQNARATQLCRAKHFARTCSLSRRLSRRSGTQQAGRQPSGVQAAVRPYRPSSSRSVWWWERATCTCACEVGHHGRVLACTGYFSLDLSHFSRNLTYVHWNIPTCSSIRIFIFGRRYFPILKNVPIFLKKSGFLRCKTTGRLRDSA